MKTDLATSVEASRAKLLAAIGDSQDVTFIRAYGNMGDHLIYAGTRQLLSKISYREANILDMDEARGHTALVAGSGGWCRAYHSMAKHLPNIEQRFERVIVMPSSFDISVPCVRETLSATKALVFAREQESFCQIRSICKADLAHDCAFFFDFTPYCRSGKGALHAFRQDNEATKEKVPQDNNDISLTCESLDEWLWSIARHERVRTDRAHVIIAAALLGKTVEYRASDYHKIPGIVEFALRSYPVTPMIGEPIAVIPNVVSPVQSSAKTTGERRAEYVIRELTRLIPQDAIWIFVDNGQFPGKLPHARVIPFLEKDGAYWGNPENDTQAISELERLRKSDAAFIVFVESSFWWLEHYVGFHNDLRTQHKCVLANERLIVFDLR
jgi:hypothetical protein